MILGAPIPVLMFIGFAVVGIIAAIYGAKASKKRREELIALAARLGLRFEPRPDPYHDEEYAHFEIFRHGFARNAFNTLIGPITLGGRPHQCKMGDFTYKTRSRDSKGRTTTTTHRFSYLIVHLPFDRMPDLLIRREGMFDKIAGVFGAADIDFESAEFSRRFHVKSPSRKFAYDIIHPRMIEFLMGSQTPTVDIERGRACCSDGSRRWDAARFEYTLGWLDEFFAQWPEFVVKDLQHDPHQDQGGQTRSESWDQR